MVLSPKAKTKVNGKWLPKSPTGDKSLMYTREKMLHSLTSLVGTPIDADDMKNIQHVFTVSVLKKEPEAMKESKRQKRAKSLRSLNSSRLSLLSDDTWQKHQQDNGQGQEILRMVMSGSQQGDNPWDQHQRFSIPPPPELDLPNLQEQWVDYYWYDDWTMPVTTVEVQNVPTKYTPLEVVNNIKQHPFGSDLNFLYLPPDTEMMRNNEGGRVHNLGICILNFATQDAAQAFTDAYNNKKCKQMMPKYPSARSIHAGPARVQGLEWNLEELRRDLILHSLEADSEWRPYLFDDGKPTPFTVINRNAKRGSALGASKMRGVGPQPVDPKRHTTIMLRNIPNKYTRSMLHDRLKELFDPLDYDFIYMPIDFNNKCNVGYAFVNFKSEAAVTKALEVFHNVECQTALPGFNSSKVVEITPARVQGLEANVEHLQNSTVMDQLRENGEWTPLLFDENGERKKFPYGDKRDSRKRDSKGIVRGGRGSVRKRASTGSAYPQEYYGCSTLTIENIPDEVNRDDMLKILHDAGFKGEIDFLYMPTKPDSKNKHQGTATVNFRRGKGVSTFMEQFNGKPWKDIVKDYKGEEEAEIIPSKLQGLHNNIRNLKQNGVLQEVENTSWAPIILDSNGDRLDVSLSVSSPLRADAPSFNPVDAFPGPKELNIKEQLEYYYSDANLVNDVFLKENMDKEGWVTIELLKTFPKLKRDPSATSEAIKKSAQESLVFEVSDMKIRLADPQRRTLYITNRGRMSSISHESKSK